MRSLGKLVGKSRSGHIIVRGEMLPPLGAPVVNRDLAFLGKIHDVFGPVGSPFVSLKGRPTEVDLSPGDPVYFLTPEDRRKARWSGSTSRPPTN